MIQGRLSHPYGLRASLDTLVVAILLTFALRTGAREWLLSGTPTDWLAARVSLVHAMIALVFLFAWKYCFSLLGLYGQGGARSWRKLLRAAKGCVLMTALLAALLLASRAGHVLAISAVFLALSLPYELARILFVRWLTRYFALRNPRRVLIVGSGRRASTAWRAIRVHGHREVTLLGFVDNRSREEMAPDVQSRYLGSIDQLSNLLLREVVDTIIISMPAKSCYGLIQQAIDLAEQVGVSVAYMNDVFQTSQKQHAPGLEELFEQLVPPQEHFLLRHAMKRTVDVFGALIGLVLAAPVMMLVAVAVKVTSRGGIFFRQERFGYRRRRFRMIKFRSMVSNAPALMDALESRNEASGPIFKIKDDPRVTPLGRLLRATSLDELPQLWNVLMGEMSLVGPRPMSVRDVTLFDDAALMRRFSVKPGLTGLWQVSGRSGVSFEQWIAYDFHYIDRWSLTLDMKILIRTLSAVMKRSGAM